MKKRQKSSTLLNYAKLGMAAGLSGMLISCVTNSPARPKDTSAQVNNLEAFCQNDNLQSIANTLISTKVSVASLPRYHLPGPIMAAGVRYTAAKDTTPAYCQVTGTFETNPETGKTAHFLATFPESWNGKYMQIGCGGHCGTFAVSDPATPPVTITTQGKPKDIIKKGYASFATDEGHVGFASGKWAIKGPGEVDQDAIDDLLYRSHKVLSTMGKEFTEKFYAEATAADAEISYSYFSGCSGGGRDALVAALRFPEAFDGIISGSPYANMVATAYQGTGLSLSTVRNADADVSPELMALVDPIVKAQCDEVDGVKDGVIQNPMACDFRPEKHLPRCADNKPGSDCFTNEQIKTLSTVLTAITDEQGTVVQPGYSVSELQAAFRDPMPSDPNAKDLWPDSGNPATGGGGMATLGNATIKVLAHRNDPNFNTRDILSFTSGGEGQVTGFRVTVPKDEVEFSEQQLHMGVAAQPKLMQKFFELDRKLMIWSNLSDQLLTPYMAINYYKDLAKMYGGYNKLQKNVRLFGMPGTAHCSGGLIVAPGNIDATVAMENWVEKGQEPDAIIAAQYPATPFGADFSKPAMRTMPLCAFPKMARYNGKGEVNDASNWSCPEDDTGMLKIGESGRQAGIRE